MTFLQYFKTDGIRGKVGTHPITLSFLLKLGQAIGIVLGKNKIKRIIIGRDTRVSGSMLQSVLEFGILSTGVSTLLADCIPTSAVAYFTKSLKASAGIMISGSHNSFQDNGIKIFDKNGIKLNKKIEFSIEKIIKDISINVYGVNFGYSDNITDATSQYIEFCKNTFPRNINLSQFTIVIDCAHGSTFFVAPKIFTDLGARVVTIAIHPNGTNINKNVGSTNILSLKKKVLLEKADIGLAFDGDGDRVIMVDHLGNIVNGDQIIYILAKGYLKKNKLTGGVVGTVMTNIGIILALQKLKIPFYAADIGDRNVYQKMKEKNWTIGGEQSGHVILLDKHSTGDGIIASLQILCIMINSNMTLYHLTNQIKLFPQVLLNVFLKEDKNFEQNLKIQNIIARRKDILGIHSRILLRRSGTESCIRIMVEGEDTFQVYKLARDIKDILLLS